MNSTVARAGFCRFAILPLAVALLTACGGPNDPQDLPPALNDPIIFVHGFNGSEKSFDEMRARFEADGWREGVELFAFKYSSTVTNAANAQTLRNHVSHVLKISGATKVDIVSHEMGSLSSRFYIRHFGGIPYVDAWVSLGGPNHGTTEALKRCIFIPCQEMDVEHPFMTELNAEVEGPPPVRYATWRSPCDEFVVPRESVAVWDAANYVTACMPNAELIRDPAIYLQVREFVRLPHRVP